MKDLILLFAILLAQVHAEFIYQYVGTGHCSDSMSVQKLPYFRIGGSIGETACVARCDGDNACLGYTYQGTDCFNFYGTTRLTVTWASTWEEGPTTEFESTTIDGLWTGFGDSSASCMKKLDYLNVGQGTCANENGEPLNWARVTGLVEEGQCRSRCDVDDACLAYRWINNLCYNFFGLVELSAHLDWTTVSSDNSQMPTRVTSFGNTGFCIAKSTYESLGGGACADSNNDLLPIGRKLETLSNKDCRQRCDIDSACLGFRYVQNMCYNVFANEALTAFNDWDLLEQPLASAGGIAQSKGNVGVCMRKKAFPTPSPTSRPTAEPTFTPTFLPTFAPTESSCQVFGRGSEFRFTWQRRCVNEWSSTCANGLVFFDLNGQEIDLASYNPTITDTGYWRSGAHRYIGAEILKDVGLSYCSEPLRCNAATQFDPEVVHIVLDREIEFSSFDLQQVDRLQYQGDWTFEAKTGDNWETLVQNDLDFGPREVRKFGYECDTCGPIATGSQLRFVFQPECRDGFSSVCVNGLVFKNPEGSEIDLSSYNPTITDTGYWRSAHNYVGADILKGGHSYCSENRACTGIPETETVTIVLDRDLTISSFDLVFLDQPQYRANSFKFEVLRGSQWMPVLEADFDIPHGVEWNFGNDCGCSINGFWHPESYSYVQGVTEGVISDFLSHGPGTGTMNQDGTVHWIWHNTGREHRGTFSDDCATLTWENQAQWFRSTDSTVRTQIDANGWTEEEFLANQDAFTALLATELEIPESTIIVSLQSIGWLRRTLSEVLPIEVYISPSESDMERVTSALSEPSALVETLEAEFKISFDFGSVEYNVVKSEETEDPEEKQNDVESEEADVSRTFFIVGVLVAVLIGILIGGGCVIACSESGSIESGVDTKDIEDVPVKRKPATKSEIALELYGEESTNTVNQEGETTN